MVEQQKDIIHDLLSGSHPKKKKNGCHPATQQDLKVNGFAVGLEKEACCVMDVAICSWLWALSYINAFFSHYAPTSLF